MFYSIIYHIKIEYYNILYVINLEYYISNMDMYLGLFIVAILLIISIYNLYQEATFMNLLLTFFLLCFISYFTIYVIDMDFQIDYQEDNEENKDIKENKDN